MRLLPQGALGEEFATIDWAPKRRSSIEMAKTRKAAKKKTAKRSTKRAKKSKKR
jgi:hypothetical protein